MRQIRSRIIALAAAFLFAGGLFLAGASQAEAGYFNDLVDGVKELSQLPSEVNALKDDYAATVDKLEQAQGALAETQDALETFRQQNEELMERNRELSATVNALTEAQQTRDANAHKMRILLFTAAGLFAGYFILLRAVRFALRR
ncbi:hypothetical protein [uncultured Paenibacillus sp.]|uniref:hypothetical protein n=1 Tax=uncultured Paenibacillus sp. TaxID=227322 RepID=UPI0015ADE387|nr:hypothetical protein [uncultured Paenibacillus sp.]